jgi:hypothetical protein
METIEIQFERVEIKPGTLRLEDKWTVELGEDIILFGLPETRWERFCRWVKYLFVKGKAEKL